MKYFYYFFLQYSSILIIIGFGPPCHKCLRTPMAATTILGVGPSATRQAAANRYGKLYDWWLYCDTEGNGKPPY